MDRSGGVIADVPSTSGAAGARSGGERGERGIRAKVEGCKVKINSWETEFAKAHGRKPTGDEVRADKQVYAMYREYRVLKAELEKGNAAQTRGGAKPSAPDPRMQTSAPLRDVGSNAPRPSSRRPAADSSDDEDDEEVVEATPVKKAAIRSRPSQSQPGPPETRGGAPTLPVAASMPPSTSAPAIAKPEVKLPPRVASKPVGGMSSSVPSLARAGSGMHRRGPAIGGFARMVEQRKAAVETSSFEPLLCDSRGVLGSDVVTKAGVGSGGAKRSPDMTLSSFMSDGRPMLTKLLSFCVLSASTFELLMKTGSRFVSCTRSVSFYGDFSRSAWPTSAGPSCSPPSASILFRWLLLTAATSCAT